MRKRKRQSFWKMKQKKNGWWVKIERNIKWSRNIAREWESESIKDCKKRGKKCKVPPLSFAQDRKLLEIPKNNERHVMGDDQSATKWSKLIWHDFFTPAVLCLLQLCKEVTYKLDFSRGQELEAVHIIVALLNRNFHTMISHKGNSCFKRNLQFDYQQNFSVDKLWLRGLGVIGPWVY